MNAALTFEITEQTRFFEQETEQPSLNLSGIQNDDKVMIELEYNTENVLIAQKIYRLAASTGSNSSNPAAYDQPIVNPWATYVVQELILAGADVTPIHLGDSNSGQYGKVDVIGNFAPCRALRVTESTVITGGQSFDILDWGTIDANARFDDIQLPQLSEGLAWDLGELHSSGTLSVVNAPASVTPILWLDANDVGSYKASNGEVVHWVDKSGNNLHAFSSEGFENLGSGPSVTLDT